MNRRAFLGALAATFGSVLGLKAAERRAEQRKWKTLGDDRVRPEHAKSSGLRWARVFGEPARVICEANGRIRRGDLLDVDGSGRVFVAGNGSHNLVAEEDGQPGGSVLVRILP